jgi:hypothetical protein
MRLPVIKGVIDRRILVNYRIEPAAISAILPPPFRPKLIRGYAIGGICLIRLKQIRPKFLPPVLGVGSENAAHRIAVQWTEGKEERQGVYIPRRDTSSRLNALGGGRLFPGEHHHARFAVDESNGKLSVSVASDDGQTQLAVSARPAEDLPLDSIFNSIAEASVFFEQGSLGYSRTRDAGRFDGLELRCQAWKVTPLEVERVQSSFFDDATAFPPESIEFDCALLMRGIAHEWHSREDLCCHDTASRGTVDEFSPPMTAR